MSTIREEMERKKYHLLQEQVACSDPNQLENKLEEKETMFLTLKTRLEILLNKLQTNSTLLETKQKEKEQQMEKQQTKTLEEIDQIQTQIQDIYGFLYALDFLSNTNMKKEEINKRIQQVSFYFLEGVHCCFGLMMLY
jgi:hypothetical protein